MPGTISKDTVICCHAFVSSDAEKHSAFSEFLQRGWDFIIRTSEGLHMLLQELRNLTFWSNLTKTFQKRKFTQLSYNHL